MHSWYDISSAPRDGTWVILKGGNTNEDFYNGGNDGKSQRPVIAFWEPSANEWEDGTWCFGYWDGSWYNCYEKPTHWMPIPE